MSVKTLFKINEQIRSPKVFLVLPDGAGAGLINIYDARKKATELGLDLVEVQPGKDSGPPICKIMDYGKLKYDISKKKKTNENADKVMKQVFVSPLIADHDLSIKEKKVLEFLQKRHRVQFGMEISGRLTKMVGDNKEKFLSILDRFRQYGVIGQMSSSSKLLSVTISPL